MLLGAPVQVFLGPMSIWVRMRPPRPSGTLHHPPLRSPPWLWSTATWLASRVSPSVHLSARGIAASLKLNKLFPKSAVHTCCSPCDYGWPHDNVFIANVRPLDEHCISSPALCPSTCSCLVLKSAGSECQGSIQIAKGYSSLLLACWGSILAFQQP